MPSPSCDHGERTWPLVLIGAEGDAYDDLVAQVHDLGLENAVRFVTQGVDPMPYFAAADLFVHGARSDAVAARAGRGAGGRNAGDLV